MSKYDQKYLSSDYDVSIFSFYVAFIHDGVITLANKRGQ